MDSAARTYRPYTEDHFIRAELLDNYGNMRRKEHAKAAAEPSILKRIWANHWFNEIVATVISLYCFGGLIFILAIHNGKPNPQMRLGLTLNAIVSILATITKVSLGFVVANGISQSKWCWFTSPRSLRDIQSFDDASRGARGSIALLFSSRIRSSASIGAVIIVLTLAFDPFVQQVIKYKIRDIQDNASTATITKASIFSVDRDSGRYINALNAGIWSEGAELDFNPVCETGDCTWSAFESVGWCSKCNDSVSTIVLSGGCYDSGHNEGSTCTLNFGQGDNVNIIQDNGANNITKAQDLIMTILEQTVPRDNNADQAQTRALGIENPLMVWRYAHFDYKESIILSHAEQCVLTPCMITYSVSFEDGIASYKILGEDYGQIYPYMTSENRGPLCWSPTNRSASFVALESQGPASRLVDFSENSFCELEGYHEGVQARLAATSLEGQTAPDAIQKVAATSFEFVMNNTAQSLTQLALDRWGTTIWGRSTASNLVVVIIEWQWLTLPAVLELSGISFLILVALSSRRCGVDLWKGSSLALLYHGLDVVPRGNRAGDVAKMEELSKKAVVRLGTSTGGRTALKVVQKTSELTPY